MPELAIVLPIMICKICNKVYYVHRPYIGPKVEVCHLCKRVLDDD